MNFESLVKSITEIFSEEPDKPFKNDNVSTDNIENSEKINSSRIRKVIEENKESVLLNKKLISVNGNEEGMALLMMKKYFL